MDNAEIEILNGYGIGSFSHNFVFDGNEVHPRQNTHIVYAQNGVMKSSFAKVLKDFSGGDRIKDHIFDIQGAISMRTGDAAIDRSKVYSVASFDNGEVESQRMSHLLVSNDLQEEYRVLTEHYRIAYFNLMEKLKQVSGSSSRDDHQTVLSDIVLQWGDNLEPTPQALINIVVANRVSIESRPDYIKNMRITVAGSKDAVKFANDNQGIIQELMGIYDEIKNTAAFVRGKFDSGNANVLIDAITKTGYLEVEHKMSLLNSQTQQIEPVASLDDLKDKLATDIDRILEANPTLKVKFKKMLKELSTASRADFKRLLESPDTKDVILLMGNPATYKRKLWEGYIKECLVEFDILIAKRDEIAQDVDSFVERANDEKTQWDNVVKKFNKKFRNLPYELDIDNKANVLLEGLEVPRPIITYRKGEAFRKFKTKQERSNVAQFLSTGEKKALYLLNVMFEIEAIKNDSEPSLVVLDDIVDSFDYKNKYAFLEYIYDVSTNYSNVRLIVLTHNYDFFRLLQSRLFGDKYYSKAWFASKKDNIISLSQAGYFKLFPTIRGRAHSDGMSWLALVPFARNLVEYKVGDVSNNDEYKLLTRCLHINGDQPTISEVRTVLGVFTGVDDSPYSDDTLFHDALLSEADNAIAIDEQSINLPLNLVIAMATRIYAERFMMSQIKPFEVNIAKASDSNFTRKLFEFYRNTDGIDEDEMLLIEDVNLMTPEHIHVNAFMYEPLIDIGIDELRELYVSVKALVR